MFSYYFFVKNVNNGLPITISRDDKFTLIITKLLADFGNYQKHVTVESI